MKDLRKILSEILKEAGAIILSHRLKYGEVKEKAKNEIITSADMAANEYIIQRLRELHLKIPIYSEEGDEDKSQEKSRWIVDPLDGTTPWVFGNSGFSISVALEKKGEIVVGAVYDPVMKEFYYAEKSKGASRDNQAIKPAKGVSSEEMLMVVDWGSKDEKRKEGLEYFKEFLYPEMFARKIIPQFAPALGLCRIAEGRIHALVCNDTWVEDHSAGVLILREAGGYCSNFYHPNEFNHREFGIIAANERSTHQRIVDFLREKRKSN